MGYSSQSENVAHLELCRHKRRQNREQEQLNRTEAMEVETALVNLARETPTTLSNIDTCGAEVSVQSECSRQDSHAIHDSCLEMISKLKNENKSAMCELRRLQAKVSRLNDKLAQVKLSDIFLSHETSKQND